MEKHFTFREITDRNELKKAFRLRYEVYEQSRMQFLLTPNEAKMDLDVFDLHSRHFGFFHNHEIAGYIRIVVDRKSYFNSIVASIGLENHVFAPPKFIENNYAYNGEANFPFLSYAGAPIMLKLLY
ncbi:MAG: GNAT family N-acetyltransferase [Haliscomenobacter sp.]|nr:GNAT family N-acyltransferase [Haliscomenobacter sp.]MBK9488548.1 GNAT family N-acetyltransferase [Haliscomenobacter sp.]